MMPNFQQKFKEEASEILDGLENDLVALEENRSDSDLINKIFRGMHTLKGSGSMMGYQHLSEFAHKLENLFDQFRTGKLAVTPEGISVALKSCDHFRALLEDSENKNIDAEREGVLLTEIRALLPESDTQPKQVKTEAISTSSSDIRGVYRIYFKPKPDIFMRGINPLVLLKNLADLGASYVFAHEEEIPTLADINPELCYSAWTVLLQTKHDVNAIRDVFIFTEGSAELKIDNLVTGNELLEEEAVPLIGEILLQRGDITRADVEAILKQKTLFGQAAVGIKATTNDKIQSALFEQKTLKQIKKETIARTATSTLRVQNEKLDMLTNSVSELVTLQARLAQYSEGRREPELSIISEYLEKLTASLRDTVMVIRMVPVEEGLMTMHRLVRDLARDLGKEARLVVEGGETELDKTVIDNLKDPIMHLVRNSLDHGLETPEDRQKSGKPSIGSIIISAEHRGSHVVISVRDDGHGLNASKILAKAIDKGLASPGAVLSDQEIYQFIFAPGFSTAEKTTNVSGRGVGMDVVKRNIEAIRGEVLLESAPGMGTTVRMKLPLTLAIIDGLLFQVADELFVVPISAVSECLELTPEIKAASKGRNILNLRDKVIPFVFLRQLFNLPGDSPEKQQILVVQTHRNFMGFVVDSVIGKHQTVVKSVGWMFSNIKEIAGATILGNGSIALILDVNTIAEQMTAKQKINEQNVVEN